MAKPLRNDFNAQRAIRDDENLDSIFTVREPRRVSLSLTRHYDKTIYLLPDTPHTRGLIGKHIEVYEYPDGRIDRRATRAVLAYTTCERLPEIGQGAIVDNKRLGHVLKIAQETLGSSLHVNNS